MDSGLPRSGRREKVELHLPTGVTLASVPDRSLDDLLRAGELDAVFSAHPPASFERSDPEIVRLYNGYESVERECVARTGIFPIMHVVGPRLSP